MERFFYSIREVSEMVNVPDSTLRYWEQVIPLLSPKKNKGGTRFYSPADVELIRRIKYLREAQSLSIPAVIKRIESDASGVDMRQRQTELLMRIHEELVELRNLL